jgi:hypothetical protein
VSMSVLATYRQLTPPPMAHDLNSLSIQRS